MVLIAISSYIRLFQLNPARAHARRHCQNRTAFIVTKRQNHPEHQNLPSPLPVTVAPRVTSDFMAQTDKKLAILAPSVLPWVYGFLLTACGGGGGGGGGGGARP